MTGRQVKIGCEFVQNSMYDTAAVMQIRPRNELPVTVLNEEWRCNPDGETHTYTDLYDNPCLRLVLPSGRSTFTYDALVQVPDATEPVDEFARQLPASQLPDEVLIYTLPSRFCLPEMLGAEAMARFGNSRPGYLRVQDICDYVWNHLEFKYGTSNALTTSFDVNQSGFGVCRDFTHLAITFCRAMEIPARYVFGYLPEIEVEVSPEPMDFAAWMEVWLEDRWWTFDPRNNRHQKGRILIGRGRDASDVAMVTAFGQPFLESMTVIAEEV